MVTISIAGSPVNFSALSRVFASGGGSGRRSSFGGKSFKVQPKVKTTTTVKTSKLPSALPSSTLTSLPQGNVSVQSPTEGRVIDQIRVEQLNARLANEQQRQKVADIRQMNFGVLAVQGAAGAPVPTLGKQLQELGTKQFIDQRIAPVKNPSFTFGRTRFGSDFGSNLVEGRSTRGLLQTEAGRVELDRILAQNNRPSSDFTTTLNDNNLLNEISQRQVDLGFTPIVNVPKSSRAQKISTRSSQFPQSVKSVETVQIPQLSGGFIPISIQRPTVASAAEVGLPQSAGLKSTSGGKAPTVFGGGQEGVPRDNFFGEATGGFGAGLQNWGSDVVFLGQLGQRALLDTVDPDNVRLRSLLTPLEPVIPPVQTAERTFTDASIEAAFASESIQEGPLRGVPLVGQGRSGEIFSEGLEAAGQQFEERPVFETFATLPTILTFAAPPAGIFGKFSNLAAGVSKASKGAGTAKVAKEIGKSTVKVQKPSDKIQFKQSDLRQLGMEDDLGNIDKELAKRLSKDTDEIDPTRLKAELAEEQKILGPKRADLEAAEKTQADFNIDIARRLPDYKDPKNLDLQLTKEAERKLLGKKGKPKGDKTSGDEAGVQDTGARGASPLQIAEELPFRTTKADDLPIIGFAKQVLKKPKPKSSPKKLGKIKAQRTPLEAIGIGTGAGIGAGVLLERPDLSEFPDLESRFPIDERQTTSPLLDNQETPAEDIQQLPESVTDFFEDQKQAQTQKQQSGFPEPTPQSPAQPQTQPAAQIPRLGLLQFEGGRSRPPILRFGFPFFPSANSKIDAANPAGDKKFFRVFAAADQPFGRTTLPLGEFVDSDFPIENISDVLSREEIFAENRNLQNPLRSPRNIVDEEVFEDIFAGVESSPKGKKSKRPSSSFGFDENLFNP